MMRNVSEAKPPTLSLGRLPLVTYGLIVAVALLIDLLTDGSFGAAMLSALPISLVALACLLTGPWLAEQYRTSFFWNWSTGAMLVLIISLGFASLGAEQAKTGELIFTYALLLMALPSSLAFPWITTEVTLVPDSQVAWRMVFTWSLCVVAGWLQWQALCWLARILQRRT